MTSPHPPNPVELDEAGLEAASDAIHGLQSLEGRAVTLRKSEATATARLAVAAYLANRKARPTEERAENENANCPDCNGEGNWAECGRCSELFGNAIDLRHAVLAARAALEPAESEGAPDDHPLLQMGEDLRGSRG